MNQKFNNLQPFAIIVRRQVVFRPCRAEMHSQMCGSENQPGTVTEVRARQSPSFDFLTIFPIGRQPHRGRHLRLTPKSEEHDDSKTNKEVHLESKCVPCGDPLSSGTRCGVLLESYRSLVGASLAKATLVATVYQSSFNRLQPPNNCVFTVVKELSKIV